MPVSVGRIVHYMPAVTPDTTYPPPCQPAIVTAVSANGTTVSLVVFGTMASNFVQGVEQDEDTANGTWHWPERV